jgi:hypothetical protein
MDGRLDLVVGHEGWNAVGLYRQEEDGSLRKERLYAVPSYGSFSSMVIADLTQDGRPDLVVGDYLVVQRSDAAPTVTAAAIARAGSFSQPSSANRRWRRMMGVVSPPGRRR